MMRKLLQHWKILVPVICLVIVIAAEKAQFIGTDSVSAAACTRQLFTARPDPAAIIHQYQQAIADEARRRDLPPELLATIIYSHQAGLTAFRRFTDCSGSAMGSDLSLGLAQIRVSTAAGNDGVRLRDLSTRTFRKYRSLLLDPVQNIRIQAKEVRLLLDRNNRSPGITAEQLIREPSVMVLLMTEYRMGRQSAASSVARLGASGIRDLGYLERNEVYIFRRDPQAVMEIQAGVRKYLDYLYCEKGLFNAEVCLKRKG